MLLVWRKDRVRSFWELPKGYQNCACSVYCTPREYWTAEPGLIQWGSHLEKKAEHLQHKSPLLLFACIWSNFQSGFILIVGFPLRICLAAWEALPRHRVPSSFTQQQLPWGWSWVDCWCHTLLTEAMSAHSKIREITWGWWKTVKI